MTLFRNGFRGVSLVLSLLVLSSPAVGQVDQRETERPPSAGQSEASASTNAEAAPTSINAGFIEPQLNLDEWIDRFEGESREVFVSRAAVVEALRIQPEQRVADVGAGTGFFARLFAEQANWVYAVDISPRFIEHNRDVAQTLGLANLTPVLCTARSIDLPEASVDLVFVCDTYHHFEYFTDTLASIHRALRPGGRLVIIDFERIPGESREWILGHVRAGKETVIDEICEAGFELTREIPMATFEENYFLIFTRPAVAE
ncbi:MAG: class I SAM-dependent methyltransferase [Planctomycetota bacterium]